jgi:PAS domain S-box-containing protein
MTTGYKIEASLHRGARSKITAASRLPSGERVVLKTSVSGGSSVEALARSRREYSVAAGIRSDHVVAYLGLERLDHGLALVQEAFGDRSLGELLAEQGLTVAAALSIGVQIAAALVDIHARDVTHRAIHPGNIMVEKETLRVKVIDFAEASVLGQSSEIEESPDARAIPLPYMSPEQTGRMNRAVDYRTDFYSLGATLYHAFAGRPPFDLDDPLAMLHAQLARSPVPLVELDARIPVQVSRIVDKLLAKDAQDRYQSARGAYADLASSLRQFERQGRVDERPLGCEDVCERFQIPQRIYGRDAALSQLLDAFAAADRGARSLVLVHGSSGIGKSSLVREAVTQVENTIGFIWGKFEQLQHQKPYSALGQALSQWCRGLLALSPAELLAWKRRILERVPTNAGLIIDFVPELARIVGPQPPVLKTGLMEAQHRFDLTLASFVSVLASPERPLVILLDDLQWADPATLHAITVMLRVPEPARLLVIGCYRDDEVDAAHPLPIMLSAISRSQIEVRSVQLLGLPEETVAELVADTFCKTRTEVAALAKLIVEKTSGNPFFVDELLRLLFEMRLVWFSAAERGFDWDLHGIAALDVTANVVDLMVRKLEHLPPATQEILQFAACIGGRFDLQLLAEAAGLRGDAVRARLAPAIRERLVVPLDPHYPCGLVDVSSDLAPDPTNYRFQFSHDGVQHAVYSSVARAPRAALHLRLGRSLLARRSAGQDHGQVFEIVGQFGRGLDLVTEPAERVATCELYLEAGKRARATSAYDEGLDYFRRGIALLPESGWSTHYKLAFDLHLGCAECAYLAGQCDEAESFSESFRPNLRSEVEQAELYAVRIALETGRGRYARAIELGRSALAALGHPIPRLNSPLPLIAIRLKVLLALRGRRPQELAAQPELTDARLRAVARIMSELDAATFLVDKKLMLWMQHDNIYLAVKHGNTATTAAAYVGYATFLLNRKHDYRRAVEFGELALKLSEHPGALALRAQILFLHGLGCNAFAENHLRTSIPILQRAVDVGLESGNLLFAAFGSGHLPQLAFLVGEPLDRVIEETEQRVKRVEVLRHAETALEMQMFRQCMRCLRGDTGSGTSLTTRDISESTLLAELHSMPGPLTLSVYYLFKVIVLTLFGEYARATRLILESDAIIEEYNTATSRYAEYCFLAAIALTEGSRDRQFETRSVDRMLKKQLKMLSNMARSAPVNFRHTYSLVCAQQLELAGEHEGAVTLYHAAIEDAIANGFSQHAALASELAASAFSRRGQHHVALAYFQAARNGYRTWGALGKVLALNSLHPELVRKSELSSGKATLDAVSVVRASQALSSEIAQPALIEKIMRVIVQLSGSQRGALLMRDRDELRIEGYLDTERNLREVAVAQLDEQRAQLVSESIARYALRTGEDVVLPYAAQSGEFMRDPYVVAHHSRSILCMPVRHRDKISGCLFLENDLASGVYTEERLAVLRPLVAQAATSLENARLYESTRELNTALESREQLLREFFDSMPVGVFVIGAQGRSKFRNRRAREITGGGGFDANVELDELMSHYHAYRTGTDEPYPQDELPITRALHGESSMAEDIELRLPDHRRVPVAVWATPIRDEHGAVQYAIVAFQDISERLEAENTRAVLEAQLHQAQRLESIGRLAGGVAHDFNNVLTPIIAYTELAALNKSADAELRDYLSQVREAAEHAAELTKQLLAVGRKQAMELRDLDLNEEVVDFEPMLRRLVSENVELALELSPELGQVRADLTQMRRVFINLVCNASDAMPDGGRITIASEDIPDPTHPKALPSGACVSFRVSDTGHGMSESTLTRVCEPFFTTKEQGKGTGLGLATVHGIVTQHGGQLLVHSELGRGSTFEVRLPRVAKREERRSPSRSGGEQGGRSGEGQVILVVEDDSAVRRVIEEVLERDGYNIVAKGDPIEALSVARGLGERLDLLVTDIIMPHKNGRQMYEEIKRDLPGLSALFVSGYTNELFTAEAPIPEGCELLRKPLAVEGLRAAVRRLIAARSRQSIACVS